MDRRTLMEARTSTAGERRAGDLDTREEEVEATEGEDTVEEEVGTEGAGAPMRDLPEESSEDGGTTGETAQRLNLNLQAGLD